MLNVEQYVEKSEYYMREFQNTYQDEMLKNADIWREYLTFFRQVSVELCSKYMPLKSYIFEKRLLTTNREYARLIEQGAIKIGVTKVTNQNAIIYDGQYLAIGPRDFGRIAIS